MNAVVVLDLILALVVAEFALLAFWRARRGHGIAARDLLPTLAAGGGLLLALRAAVAGAGWPWIAAGLTAALVAHVFDLRRRWR